MINNINVVLLHGEISAKVYSEEPEHAYNVRKLTRKTVECRNKLSQQLGKEGGKEECSLI